MKNNPPAARKMPQLLPGWRKSDWFPGKDFDSSKLSVFDKSIDAIPNLALMKMAERVKSQQPMNGWVIFGSNVGDWGCPDYLVRGTDPPCLAQD